MNNADMPAMPAKGHVTFAERIDGKKEPVSVDTSGLTKLEYFAAHAPDIPDWYIKGFLVRSAGRDELTRLKLVATGGGSFEDIRELSSKGKMAALKQWRYDYAKMMLEGE